MCSSLRIRDQLPAPIVNDRGDSIWKWLDFQLWRARDLDFKSGHTAYRRASLIDLYLRAKLHWNWQTNIRTHVCMDRHLRPALLGRLCRRVDLIKTKYAITAHKQTTSHNAPQRLQQHWATLTLLLVSSWTATDSSSFFSLPSTATFSSWSFCRACSSCSSLQVIQCNRNWWTGLTSQWIQQSNTTLDTYSATSHIHIHRMGWLSQGFMSHSTQNWSLRSCSSQSISLDWYERN